ncbi:ATP-binding cassette domain-containing protein [Vibrio sp. SS-MA-C1-2]|uniref:ATP-binding cassette domain-containing protein n=1 Tax=Vibrio sp. SS-MA-C1-2 TaxID=2908646 RepID=UPI0021A56A92|nr:ATP-binding cassette domain-containing protein [Vibrio sp. SS-MA-C1-2]
MDISISNIVKSFGSIHVLKSVSMDVKQGSVHALMGENGAGKSTLIKVIGGVHQKDSGSIYINGQEVEIENISKSIDLGIAYVHQELNVVNELTILDNIFLGKEKKESSV